MLMSDKLGAAPDRLAKCLWPSGFRHPGGTVQPSHKNKINNQ
jgi:hypothetical protein